MPRRRTTAPTGSAGKTISNPIVLGRRIRDAHQSGEFQSFCACIPIHTRKAYDLMAIADAVDRRRLLARDVQALGWSKARLIASQADTQEKARRAVAFARVNTLPALVAYFQADGSGTELITKSFHLTPEQARQLDAALEQAGGCRRNGRFVDRSAALMAILRGYRCWAKCPEAARR